MRDLEINKRSIFYALRTGTKEGSVYGETLPVYGEPQLLAIRVEYIHSSVSITEYNKDSSCDVRLISSDTGFPFDEHTIFWVNVETAEAHDYVMARLPNRSINGTVIYLRKAVTSDA